MKAVLGSMPHDPTGWAFEVKWDGYRTIAFVDDGRVRLQSTGLHDVTAQWPELAGFAGAVHATTAVVDGELVVLDDEGRPRFDLVQRHDRPAAFFAFDVLRVGDHDTVELPYEQRRRLLEQLVEPGDLWAVPPSQVGDGEPLLEATAAQGLEGVMAKRLGSTYRPGARSNDWVKIKHRRRTEVVIGGYTAGEGNRSATFGALLVGRRDDRGGLAFAGGVGTGFDQRTLEALRRRLDALRTDECPFPVVPAAYRRGATWVRPELTATIEIAEITNDGFVRHASFVGLLDV